MPVPTQQVKAFQVKYIKDVTSKQVNDDNKDR